MEASLPLSAGALPASLTRVVQKYRRDVHRLAPPAAAEALTAVEGHLGRSLPPGLRAFLREHNGASLFRGALRIRSTSELAEASAELPGVVLFADTNDDERWAFAADEGGPVFGRWTGERLEAEHRSFHGWLAGCIAVLETRVHSVADRAVLRFEADPSDAFQLVAAGRRHLATGEPELAEDLLRQATHRDPTNVWAWQFLGDAVAIADRSSARHAWLEALRHSQLPLPYPGAPCLAPEALRSLARTLHAAESWERELQRFVEERVADIASEAEAELVVEASLQWSRSLVDRGQRSAARDVLMGLVARARAATHRTVPWVAVLALVRLAVNLGDHDEAEALIRRVLREGPSATHGAALVTLAEIATSRQEPWAEEIFFETEQHDLGDEERLRLGLLRVERATRGQRLEVASRHLDGLPRLARRLGKPRYEGLVCLAAGDVERLRGQLERADAAYLEGLKRVGDACPETRDRLHLRRADTLLALGDRSGALAACDRAVRGFGEAELPVREAWALVRLARLTAGPAGLDPQLLARARERFVAADLAAGVAALDSLAGDPGYSLAWHLERATAQARARHNAQRPRAPWDRSDADRPERRLGAHRLAIAACDEDVVRALADQMERSARAISGRARATEPAMLQYVAAVDLLAGHRSYDAARILLDHLLARRVEGPAHRALQGAIARSPNAALVDGLLSCIEAPARLPSASVAAAAELLGLRGERCAVPSLTRLLETGSPLVKRAAVTARGRMGDRRAVDAIAAVLDEPTLAEASALSLLMLGDARGVHYHATALEMERSDLQGHPGEIVGRYGGPGYLPLLLAAAQGASDRALGALQGLGLLGDPRGVPALLSALHNRDRKVVEVASGALQILTGRVDDPEQPGVRQRWSQWFDDEGDRLAPGVRLRDGALFDGDLLIRKMDDADPWVRRTAYDELVIFCGHDLAFDADGPWRVQRAHVRAWRAWWRSAKARFIAGGWYLDGKRIG